VEPQRKNEIVEGLSDAVRAAAVELGITNDEWTHVLAFLTEVGKAEEFILLSDTMKISVAIDALTHDGDARATASNVLGPFYLPDAPFLDADGFGVHLLAGDDEAGEPLFVSGTVSSVPSGRPLGGAVLDVWQADDDRRYSNQDEAKDAFHLRGRIRTSEDGRYVLRTVTPPPYEVPKDGPVGTLLASLGRHHFRPAHLHVRASADGHADLTTMVFVAGDPWIDDDTIGAVKESLIVDLLRHTGPSELSGRGVDRPFATATFDIRLRASGGHR
jgi:protocatechuate 3,4-dioxygenase beta subunit